MTRRFWLLLIWTALAACGSSGDEDYGPDKTTPDPPPEIPNDAPIQQPTALTCPQGTFLTYKNFGAAFVNKYCISCHSRSAANADRNGAPLNANFDTASDLTLWRNSILGAATGDKATMPPGKQTTQSDQTALTEWLNCGAPKG